MFGIGTAQLMVMLIIAFIMLRGSFSLRSSDLVESLKRGVRALFGIEGAVRNDSKSIVQDIFAALLVIALVTITALRIVAMLPN